MTFIGISLIASGIIVKSQDDHFRSLRNDYLPHFRHLLNDYLQFSPRRRVAETKKLWHRWTQLLGKNDDSRCVFSCRNGDCRKHAETNYPC